MRPEALLLLLFVLPLAAEDADRRRATDNHSSLTLGMSREEVVETVGEAFWMGGGSWTWVDDREDAHLWQLHADPADVDAARSGGTAPTRFLVVRYRNDRVSELKLVHIGGTAIGGSGAGRDPAPGAVPSPAANGSGSEDATD